MGNEIDFDSGKRYSQINRPVAPSRANTHAFDVERYSTPSLTIGVDLDAVELIASRLRARAMALEEADSYLYVPSPAVTVTVGVIWPTATEAGAFHVNWAVMGCAGNGDNVHA